MVNDTQKKYKTKRKTKWWPKWGIHLASLWEGHSSHKELEKPYYREFQRKLTIKLKGYLVFDNNTGLQKPET